MFYDNFYLTSSRNVFPAGWAEIPLEQLFIWQPKRFLPLLKKLDFYGLATSTLGVRYNYYIFKSERYTKCNLKNSNIF
jgi:hypothetical protein